MNKNFEILNICINNKEVFFKKIDTDNKVLISFEKSKEQLESESYTNKILECNYDFDIIDNYRERIIKTYIIELLEILELKKIQVDKKNHPIISKWIKYVEGYTHADDKDFLDNKLLSILKLNTDIFIEILKNPENKYLLLEDRFLSPEIISLKSEESNIILNYIEKLITSENKELKVAIINSPELNKVLLNRMQKNCRCDLINIKSKTINNTNKSDSIITEIEDINNSAANLGQYDYVILFNSIHLYEEAFDIICKLEKMLKKDGKLIVTDFEKMNPIALMLGIFFNTEYLGVYDETRNEFFYKKDYIEQLFKKKFDIVESKTIYNNRIYLIEGICKNDYTKIIDSICKEIDVQAKDLIILKDGMSTNEIIYLLEKIQVSNEHILSDNEKILEISEQDEEKLKSIWKDNLENENLDFTKNYFELGGDSLMATKLLIKINEEFNCNISMVEFFKHLRFADMLTLVQRMANDEQSVIYGEL